MRAAQQVAAARRARLAARGIGDAALVLAGRGRVPAVAAARCRLQRRVGLRRLRRPPHRCALARARRLVAIAALLCPLVCGGRRRRAPPRLGRALARAQRLARRAAGVAAGPRPRPAGAAAARVLGGRAAAARGPGRRGRLGRAPVRSPRPHVRVLARVDAAGRAQQTFVRPALARVARGAA
jgi:hypothetical protein